MKENWRKPGDPIAFAITVSSDSGTHFTTRVYLHLKKAKVWRLYDTREFGTEIQVNQCLETLYPGITNLKVDKL